MIQALHRALTLVELVAAEPAGLTLTEIGERCDLNFRTAQSLLRSLKDLGMLDLDPRGKRYRLGPAVALLMGSQSLSQILRPILADTVRSLAEELDQNVALATIDQGTLEVICNYDPSRPGALGECVRVDNPLSMCTGQLLLAHGESPVWLGAAPQVIARLEKTLGKDPGTIHQDFKRIREQGWNLLERDQGPYRAIIAVPLRHQGHVFAALATHLPSGDPRGSSAAALRRWRDNHHQKLDHAARVIAQRWPGA
jgi:IclR family acetate operon transcriptional repressor